MDEQAQAIKDEEKINLNVKKLDRNILIED